MRVYLSFHVHNAMNKSSKHEEAKTNARQPGQVSEALVLTGVLFFESQQVQTGLRETVKH